MRAIFDAEKFIMKKHCNSNISRGSAFAGGFTLIELLSAMAILIIIVMMMTRIFVESERAWQLGVGRAEINTEGRAALNMIAHDLQYAVADNILTFAMGHDRRIDSGDADAEADATSYGFKNDEICFVSLQHDSTGEDTPRTAREIHYWVREMKDSDGNKLGRYELLRGYFSSSLVGENYEDHCYHNREWWKDRSDGGAGRPTYFSQGVVAENIAAVAFFAPNELGTIGRYYRSAENTEAMHTNRLPQYVDIYIEALSDMDAEKAGHMKWLAVNRPSWGVTEDDMKGFVEKSIRRYTTRVFFHNRFGYMDRSDERFR